QELAQGRAVPASVGQALVGCGRARPGHEIEIVDVESGGQRAVGIVGEIQVSGPSVALGYWQNPEATQQTFVRRGGRVFLRTGDLGFVHDGELFVTGRQKDLIIVRGQNLYPQDIERGVEEQVKVLRQGRVVAFGLERAEQEGIVIAAEVSPRMRKLIDPPSVRRAISELVAQSFGEPPIEVLLLEPGAVPTTSSGKLQRSACKGAWLAGELALLSAKSEV
ncbi:MAG TPA: non-ribosomal peptide synthetase, partial [Polyangiales bacterium]|nr:non-ribosomal peptide synthetase [Polyangiales bacterium]